MEHTASSVPPVDPICQYAISSLNCFCKKASVHFCLIAITSFDDIRDFKMA